MPTVAHPAEPVVLRVDADRGLFDGSSERYEKRLADLRGIYRSDAAFEAALAADDGEPVYWVESSTPDTGRGALTVGLSVLRPGRIGDEFAMTRGHLHAQSEFAELYHGISGSGVMLLDSVTGESRALPIGPGISVHVPGGWVHRSVNVGTDLLVTVFAYATEAGQDYGIIERAGGMSTLVVDDGDGGWTTRPNPDHGGYRA
ncbi:glucose-6-phosphate isomerase family protein [Microbacterium sp. XT11]|uniref:glucose-6-phosphate isomerase family protein n=1 Tax=Microbacterium sp. XT11 TaxID=367477 RepID=UPI000742E4E1|nr:glucose-6-phosphate isomerase family protein [Microbacterium sp. XT11]ALX65764.1 thermophilic glucose-6-phosphate isomerase [Microbacterium sp. XT11]